MSARDTPADHPLDQLAASVVAEDTAPTAAVGWGALMQGEVGIHVGGDTAGVFDLASVTKVLTALAWARSGLDVFATIRHWLPELRETASADVSIEALLGHRGGLVAHLELFAKVRDGLATAIDVPAAYVRVANARREETGELPALYSDLGYQLAGLALARALGVVDAGAAIEALVVQPLGLGAALGTARSLGDVRYVPTEWVRWRSPAGPLCGIVHDENAWVLTGTGASGHAGMFGTIAAVLRIGLETLRMLRGTGPLAVEHDIRWLARPIPGTTWRAGFDGKSASGSSAGAFASSSSFGHLGFTGTSLWIDPERERVTSLLCNRVNPSRDRVPAAGGIKVTRPRVHDALFRLASR